jgi:hypothetical protein
MDSAKLDRIAAALKAAIAEGRVLAAAELVSIPRTILRSASQPLPDACF